ncbi:MAG: ornithine cyclodeaminase/alanine dehydrogenase-like protein (mu-crystallin family) [Verrucomicrobiales bacterium]|jgi:ornithine cyclodeaminase/alanine dehydrogenase-like protein (mu-crystallin family)
MEEQRGMMGDVPLSTLVLDVDDLTAVIADVGLDAFMDELIDVLRREMASFDPAKVEHRVRAGFNYESPTHGLVEWMPTMVNGDVVSVKTVGYHPSNPTVRNIPSVLATTALYDTTTGSLMALCEATLLTALRTGAASAVMTAALTAPGPITLGVVGCGAQAVTQIHAIARVRKIDRLIVTDSDRSVAATLARRLPEEVVRPEVLSRAAFGDAVGDMDVLCTCTSVPIGDGPVVDLSGARSGLHVNAVGSDFPGKTELPIDFLRRAIVIPDIADQCLVEGESQRLQRHELGPDIVDVLSGSMSLVDETTVFDSTGWSFEDLLSARLFHEHAVRLDRGTFVELQRAPVDPYDPYETLRTTAALRSIENSALALGHG